MKKPLIAIITVVALGIGYYFGTALTDGMFEPSREAQIAEALENAAQVVNDGAPSIIDESTRLDGAQAGPGNQLTYSYTLLGVDASQIDKEMWEDEFVPMIKRNVMNAEGMRYLFEIGTTANYRYHDVDGNLIDQVTILASEVMQEGRNVGDSEEANVQLSDF